LIKDNFKQQHFVVYELVLPYCTACTPSNNLTESWHTPITCDEPSDDEYSLWFTSNSAPIIAPPSQSISIKSRLNSSVWRVVTSGSESTPTLKPGEGMASRGSMSVSMSDFKGDPGPINFSDDGTFFGKLKARNILDGKKIISHYYSITSESGSPVEVNTSTHFIEKTTLTGGRFTIRAKDALKDLEAFSQQFPIPTEATLTSDIDDTTTTIPVSDGSMFAVDDVIIIDKELMRISSISVNDLTVYARGSTYLATDSSIIYKTNKDSHSEDSSVQICYVMNKSFLSNVLQDIFNSSGLSAYVDFTQWDDEILEWNENAFLYGVFHEPEEVDDLINRLLTDYMVDMWLDQSTQKVVVNATTAWKQAIRTIYEGNDLSNLTTSTKENSRFSRAYIYNQKDFQAENDDAVNYSRLTLHKDTATESSDFYGSIKVKEFDPSSFISPSSAQILVSRFVQRFSSTPELLNFTMEERKLSGLSLGDIVDVVSRDSQSPSGATLEARTRTQLISIKPDLNKIGRMYKVQALSYVPLIATTAGQDLTIFISGVVFDIDLYARAGAPPDALNVTFVFDGATIGSSSAGAPAIRAGLFDAATAIKMIFTNNSKVSAKGGNGGAASISNTSASAAAGVSAGDVYQSDGITTSIYLNYGTVDGYVTSAELHAPGGGGGGATCYNTDESSSGLFVSLGAAGGGGGSGIPEGSGGAASVVEPSDFDGVFSSAKNGFNGTFSLGGNGGLASIPFPVSSAKGGKGGASLVAGASSSSPAGTRTKQGAAGAAGAAIKGAGVTVYNLAASSSKFKSGNSDSFTLITV
jgi:hypothetical protein